MHQKFLLTLLLAFGLLFFNSPKLSGQSTNREIGLRMSGLSDFNFIYKKAKAENKFVRYRAGAFNANYSLSSGTNYLGLGFNLAMGVEKRRSIDDKLSFIHGFEPSLRLNLVSSNGNGNIGINPSLGYLLGFHLNVSNSIGISIETVPSIGTVFTLDEDGFGDVANFNFGFNSNSVALSVLYRFKK